MTSSVEQRREYGPEPGEEPMAGQMIPINHGLLLVCPGKRCGRILGIGELGPGGAIEIKCRMCKTYARFMRIG